ncbi:fimbrial protein [Pseudomonas sp. B329]|uniref:fimbrial protein n=1 Tax=Pseudomonas sp. B329 TaxID=1553459 RepID=UPI00200663E4|nr:fimbrial protein [Pseudomonas sp. B329]
MRIKKLLLCFILVFLSLQVHATYCTYNTLTVGLYSSFTYKGAGAGMISQDWHQASDASLMNCDVTGSGKFEIVTDSPLASAGVYSFGGETYTLLQSSIPDVSFIMSVADTKGNWKPYKGVPLTTYDNEGTMSSTFGIKILVRLVATGRLDPGSYSLPAVNLLNTGVKQGASYTGSAITKTTSTVITSKSPTCKLSGPSEYALPKIDLSEIGSVNAKAGTTAVAISATCEGAAVAYSVKYSLVDVNSSVAGSNYVTLRSVTESGSLESIGLQLTDDATTILMGTAYPVGQIPVAGGVISRKLLVSYVRRTMAIPSPGRVSGEVALVLSYD